MSDSSVETPIEEEKDTFADFDEKAPPQDIGAPKLPRITRLAQLIRRSIPGIILGFLYCSHLLGFLILVDAVFNLQTPHLRSIAYIFCSALLSPLHMLWTHTLVSEKRKSISSFGMAHYGTLILPSVAYAGAQILLLASPFAVAWIIPQPAVRGWIVDWFDILLLLLIAAGLVVVFVCGVIPAGVVLTRVEVALMGCDHDSLGVDEDGSPGLGVLVHAVHSVDFWVVQRVLKVYCILGCVVVANLLVLLFV